MRLSLRVEGGFAGLGGGRRPRIIDLEVLPRQVADQVRGLLEGVDFFALPEFGINAPRGAADYLCYAITAEDGQQRHTVRVPEVGAPPMLQELVDRLLAL